MISSLLTWNQMSRKCEFCLLLFLSSLFLYTLYIRSLQKFLPDYKILDTHKKYSLVKLIVSLVLINCFPLFYKLVDFIFIEALFLIGRRLWGSFRLTIQSNILSFKFFCRDQNKWKSEGGMSREYNECWRVFHFYSFCKIGIATCSLAL